MTTAVITGSASGIGGATRGRLEAEGVRVVGVDLKDAEVIADLSTAAGRAAAVAEVLERTGGRIDRLVVAAGIGGHLGQPGKVLSVNYFGALSVLDGCLDALRRGADPAAVVLCSNSAKMLPTVDDSPTVRALLAGNESEAIAEIEKLGSGDLAYLCSKNALGKAVRRRALEWGRAGVRLNAVAPGPVQTPLLQGGLDTPGTGDAIRALENPLGRFAQPDEIAGLIAFLLGPEAAYVHGSVYYIDGGIDANLRPDGY